MSENFRGSSGARFGAREALIIGIKKNILINSQAREAEGRPCGVCVGRVWGVCVVCVVVG